MGAIALYKNEYSRVHEELLPVAFLGTNKLKRIEDFLFARHILSLSDVELSDVITFYQENSSIEGLSELGTKGYASALETAVRIHLEQTIEFEELEEVKLSKDKRNKLSFFLRINHIHSLEEIDAYLKRSFENYLIQTKFSKITEFVKTMDIAKFHSLEKEKQSFRPKHLKYANTLLYLAYHPDYDIAHRFFYTQIKEPLYFDFSANVSETIKRQVFSLLKHVVEEMPEKSTHYLLQVYITPLWHLYNYCIENGIDDISTIKDPELSSLRKYIEENASAPLATIVNTLRKHLFLQALSIDWNASAWYFERFHLAEGRMNQARPFEALYFDDIKIEENLEMLKSHIKYQLGLTTRLSITSIYAIYNAVKNFLHYCDEKEIYLCKLTKADLEKYISFLFLAGNKPEATNKQIKQLNKFLRFLEIKEIIPALGFHYECYLATEVKTHNDISVPNNIQEKVFEILDQFPEDLRLMFLNLWSVGLRVNEVCVLKGNAYLFDGTTAWLLIYQNKAKKEKRVPIPMELYSLMTEYITKKHIKPDEFIFPAPLSDGPYRAGTFTKKVKQIFSANGISEFYHFKSHGYRHTMATELYMNGSNIQCIREYLGHASENMTKQYIDHLPNMVDQKNDDYFNSKSAFNWK